MISSECALRKVQHRMTPHRATLTMALSAGNRASSRLRCIDRKRAVDHKADVGARRVRDKDCAAHTGPRATIDVCLRRDVATGGTISVKRRGLENYHSTVVVAA